MRVLTGAEVQEEYECRVRYEAWCEQQTLDTTPELRALAERYRRERGKAYQAAMRNRLTPTHNH